jgi:hypothetical protein
MTVVDRLGVAGDSRNRTIWKDLANKPGNARICWSLDVTRWKTLLFDALAR